MKKIIILLLSFLIGSCLFAQSADVITSILNTNEVTYGQVCYLSAVRQGFIKDKASFTNAINALYEKGQIDKKYSEEEKIPLCQIAAIFVKIWPEKKQSLMYNLSKGSPRYAYKLLKSLDVIDSKMDSSQFISGRETLNILSECMIVFDSKNECMTLSIEE